MDLKHVQPLPSIWLRVGWFGEYIVEDANDSFLELLGFHKDDILGKSLLKSAIFPSEKGKNLSRFLMKTALDYVKTYKCSKKIEKFYHLIANPKPLREFFWAVECHPIRKEGEKLRIRIDIQNLVETGQNHLIGG